MTRETTGNLQMTDNLPAMTKSKTPTSGLRPDARLNALLASGENPVVGPNTAAACREIAERPEPETVTEAQVETMLGKLAMATAKQRVSDAEADARFELYWLALRDIPACDLREAFVELIQTCKFLPTPAEVRDAALAKGAPRKMAKTRARYLAWKHEQEWEPPKEYVDADEVAALLAGAG